MKRSDCIEKYKQTDGIQDESLCYAICDLLCHLKRRAQWTMAIISLLFTLCLFYVINVPSDQFCKLSSSFLSVFPSTLGLSITAYAVVIGFQPDTVRKLLKKDDNNAKPFHVICASMIFNGLLQTITIMLTFVYQLYNDPLFFYFLFFVGCYSLIQIMDILFQLLGLRTFVAKIEN